MRLHPCVMVMGPSGVGKTSLAITIADRLGAIFLEGDDYHPAENRASMIAGKPLTDHMRWPWLTALADVVLASARARPTVFTCSALKRSYRAFLRERIGDYRLIYLHADPDLIRSRMQARQHFMRSEMLDSQLAILEAPAADEAPIVLDTGQPVPALCNQAIRELNR